MAKNGQEVVFEGWLTKSPPTKRIWRARWRRRWFSLKHSGEIPDQFILMYYADRNCRKLKGCINLDDCEQVDLGLKLEDRKQKFDHVFDIKTPDRTYYLAADSESEMKSWVTYICKVCGLKGDEEDLHSTTIENGVVFCEDKKDEHSPIVPNPNETPPISPVSTSPYIPISECITGKSPLMTSQDFKALLEQNFMNSLKRSDCNEMHLNQTYGISQRNYLNYVNDMQDPRFYDSPRSLAPAHKNDADMDFKTKKNSSPLQSPTDTESGFTDDDGGDAEVFVTQKFTRVNANSKKLSNDVVPPPPRPPKSVHVGPINHYMNLGSTNKIEQEGGDAGDEKVQIKSGHDLQKIVTDDMYDFPRSHQVDTDSIRNAIQRRHCYNNAAPVKVEGQIFRYDISPKPSTSANQVFRYDLEDSQDEPASPLSQTSSTTAYSNLPSPLLNDGQIMPPPVVNRDLKPKRKLSDSLSLSSNPEPSSPRGAPSVDRKLKPPTPLQDNRKTKPSVSPSLSQTRKTLSIDEDTRKTRTSPTSIQIRRNFDDDGRKIRAAPSPTPPGLARSHESLLTQREHEQIYYCLSGKMQYLDLDLDCGPSNFSHAHNTNTMPSKSSAGASYTVYKKVDFEKTQAFNIARNILEMERKEPVTFTKK